MAITIGAHLSHYQIRSPLGAGGMGEVYRALDTRLDREVALKLLPVEFTQDEERVRRFRQEAKAASALNHPNIITIYEIGQEQGKYYLATEFIDGQTLRRQLQSGPLKMAAALEIATQIAAALAAAHEAGIIHRDIKPENVMVRPDGIVKVLDFGLAKLTEKPAHTDLNTEAATLANLTTEAGTVMGTPQYMSPEQARGLRVDKRTDLFSFGIVLFEMLTERPPFAGETISHLIVAILEKEPPPLAQFLPDVPAELEHILKRTLAKRAEERYASAKDLLLDLKKLQRRLEYEAEFSPPTAADQPDAAATQKLQQAPTVPTGARQAITANAAQDEYKTMVPAAIVAPTQTNPTSVLPAAVTPSLEPSLPPKRKAKPQWWWFGLLGLLLLAGGLFVYRSWATQSKQIASIAVLPFENASGNADVEYLSDGMTETLISSLSQLPNLHVKARSSVFRYKGQVSDAPTIGRELNVQAILNGRVVQHGEDLILYLELVDAPTGNRIWGDQYNKKLTNLVALQTEIARDVSQKLQTRLSGADEQRLAKNHTENAQAYQLYLRGRFYWNKRTTNDTQRAVEYFHQAIAIDPNYARGYAGLADAYALVSFYDSALPLETMPKAKAAALKALALDGNLAEAHASLGFILTTFDYDFAGAEAQYKRAIELDPNYASAHQWYGELLSYLGQHEAASAELRRALELDPFSLVINRTYGSILFVARKYDESIAQSKKTLELDGNYAAAHLGLAMAYQLQGNHAGCVEEFAKYQELAGDRPAAALMRASLARDGWIGFLRMMTGARRPENLLLYNPAMLLAALGEKDAAFAALNKAYENREFILVWLKVDPRLDPLRDDSRFQALLQRVGLPTQ